VWGTKGDELEEGGVETDCREMEEGESGETDTMEGGTSCRG
jgi:hypothetical protein